MTDTFTTFAAPMPAGERTVRLSPDKHEEWLTSAVKALVGGQANGYGFLDPQGVEHAVIALMTPSGAVWGAYDFRMGV